MIDHMPDEQEKWDDYGDDSTDEFDDWGDNDDYDIYAYLPEPSKRDRIMRNWRRLKHALRMRLDRNYRESINSIPF